MAIRVLLGAAMLLPGRLLSDEQFTWSEPRTLVSGQKCDVITDGDGTIHLITAQYYQFDSDGNELTSDSHGDNCQGGRDDGPSIDIGPEGKIYELTKSGGGHTHQITFRLRARDGSIERELKVSEGLRDNRTMAVWPGNSGEAYWMHSNNVGYPNPPDHYDLNHVDAGGNTVLGDLLFNSTQIDYVCDAARSGDIIAGAMGGKHECSYAWADVSREDILGQMEANRSAHSGTDRPGWPALYTDGEGDIHLVYGGSDHPFPEKGKIFYNRYENGKQKVFDDDVLVLEGWPHRGVPAVATSEDGNTIVCVGVAGPADNGWENNAVLIWSYSTDAGASWSPKDTIDGTRVDTDEGFRRPRMTAFGNRVFLFFNRKHDSNISLTVLDTGPVSAQRFRPVLSPASTPVNAALKVNLLGRAVRDNGVSAGASAWHVVRAELRRDGRTTALLRLNGVHP